MGHSSVDVGICDPYSHLKQHPPGEGMAHATADSRQSERHGKGCRGRVGFRKKLLARRPGLTFEGVEMIEIYIEEETVDTNRSVNLLLTWLNHIEAKS